MIIYNHANPNHAATGPSKRARALHPRSAAGWITPRGPRRPLIGWAGRQPGHAPPTRDGWRFMRSPTRVDHECLECGGGIEAGRIDCLWRERSVARIRQAVSIG